MTADHVYANIIRWLAMIIALALYLALAVVLIRAFGITLPIRATIGHVELAYLAGAYWLLRK